METEIPACPDCGAKKWVTCELYCEDCGDHAGYRCEDCGHEVNSVSYGPIDLFGEIEDALGGHWGKVTPPVG